MTAWGYQAHSITLDNYDNVPSDLQEALNKHTNNDQELVSCFPQPEHRSGELHQVPLTGEGSDPYDDVWHTPTGPTFIIILKRAALGEG